MKYKTLRLSLYYILLFCASITCLSCGQQSKESVSEKYIFFLHNRFLETHDIKEKHPLHGKVEYVEILNTFEKSGFQVISEKRNANTNAQDYAEGLLKEINALIEQGVEPNKITIIGTSKGGYIAQYVSTLAKNQNLNFVFLACFTDDDILNIPDINYCGNILTIYEKTDPYGVSASKRNEKSICQNKHFKEIELNTGLGHGFIFQNMDEWMTPCIEWANGNYNFD